MAEGSVKAAERKRKRLEGDLKRLEKSYDNYSSQLEKVEDRLAQLSGDDAEEEAVKEIAKKFSDRGASLEREISDLEDDVRREEKLLEDLRENAERASVKTFFSRLFLPDAAYFDRSIERSEKKLDGYRSDLSRKRQAQDALAAELKRQSEQKASQISREQEKCRTLAADLRSSLKSTAEEIDAVMGTLEELEPERSKEEAPDAVAASAPASAATCAQPVEVTADSGADAKILKLEGELAAKDEAIRVLTESGRGLKDDSAQYILNAIKENKKEISDLRRSLNGDDILKKIDELDKKRISNSTAPGEEEKARKLMTEMLVRLVFDPYNEVTPGYRKDMSVEIEKLVRENTTASIYRILGILQEKLNLNRWNEQSDTGSGGEKTGGSASVPPEDDSSGKSSGENALALLDDGQEAGPLDISEGAPGTKPHERMDMSKLSGNSLEHNGNTTDRMESTAEAHRREAFSRGQKLPIEQFKNRLFRIASTPPYGYDSKLYVTPVEGGETYLTDEKAVDFALCDFVRVNEKGKLEGLSYTKRYDESDKRY